LLIKKKKTESVVVNFFPCVISTSKISCKDYEQWCECADTKYKRL